MARNQIPPGLCVGIRVKWTAPATGVRFGYVTGINAGQGRGTVRVKEIGSGANLVKRFHKLTIVKEGE